MIKLFLIEDHRLFRASIQQLISREEDVEIVAESSGKNFSLEELQKHQPDLVICDLELPETETQGLDLCRQIKEKCPTIKIIILTQYLEKSYIREAIKLEIEGYIHKNVALQEFLSALTLVHQGEKYYPSDVLNVVLNDSPTLEDFHLSERELEILRMISDGRKSREIAEELNISIKTVGKHRANILAKLEVKNTAELVSFVLKNKLI